MSFGASKSSDLLTADAVIAARPCYITGVNIIPAAAASTIVIYDNASAASGTVVAKVTAVANGESVLHQFDSPIECLKGAYADVTGASAGFIVYYILG